MPNTISKRRMSIVAVVVFFPVILFSQHNPDFNVSLQIDYASAEQMIGLCEGKLHNVNALADLKGTQLAAATSAVLARKQLTREMFVGELEALRDNFRNPEDNFGLAPVRAHLEEIKALLSESMKRQLDRRVLATIEQFFPTDARISATISVYIVAFGNENASAFVRRVLWEGNTPQFVGPGEGEPVMVVNLQRLVGTNLPTEIQFVETLSTLAHETFHAVFEVYQATSPVWQALNARRSPVWALAELVQNEGIAYRISYQQRSGASLPPYVFSGAKSAVGALNDAMAELMSPDLSPSRAHELLLNANLSGSFEKNYGASAGLLMAFAIDTKMGRQALAETIANGVGDFFQKYDALTKQYDELPKLSEGIRRELLK